MQLPSACWPRRPHTRLGETIREPLHCSHRIASTAPSIVAAYPGGRTRQKKSAGANSWVRETSSIFIIIAKGWNIQPGLYTLRERNEDVNRISGFPYVNS